MEGVGGREEEEKKKEEEGNGAEEEDGEMKKGNLVENETKRRCPFGDLLEKPS